MAKLAALLVTAAVLALALSGSEATLAQSKANLRTMKSNLAAANIANEYIYDRNPNVLTLCTNRFKRNTDSEDFTQYINGCVGKALGYTGIDAKLKAALGHFVDEALATATTVERLDRVVSIIGCAITESLAKTR